MRQTVIPAAFFAALVLGTSSIAAGSGDYVLAEPAPGAVNAPRSLSRGATVGPSGEYLFPLRYHYTSDIGISHAGLRAHYEEVTRRVNRIYRDSGVNVQFVLEEIAPIGYPSTGDTIEDIFDYLDAYPADGRFGVLLVPYSPGLPRGFLIDEPWPEMPLRAIVPSGEFSNPVILDVRALTVAHEIGHNLGLRHGGECPIDGNIDGCGYSTPSGSYTVMGAGTTTTYRFSDPTYLFRGEPLGDEHANAVRFVNEDRLPVYAEHVEAAMPPCDTGEPIQLGQAGRFEARVCWRTQSGTAGNGQLAVPSEDSAVVWFFSPDNWEMLIKVLDACGEPFNRFWVFFAATTNVEFTLTVTDTDSGLQKTYFNPLGQAANTVNDTDAFATCP